jgi:hypothetical protein
MYQTHLDDFRGHFDEVSRGGEDFGDFAGAYKCGATLREDYPRYSWLEVRREAIDRWAKADSPQPWERVDLHVKFAFNCCKEKVTDGSQGVAG